MASTLSPLTVNAQNSALLQGGKGHNEGEQQTEQLQSSNQNGQGVSGDSSLLSGNNLVCQNQDNLGPESSSEGFCQSEGLISTLPNFGQYILTVRATASSTAEKGYASAHVVVTDKTDGSTDTLGIGAYGFMPPNSVEHNYIVAPNHEYNIKVIPQTEGFQTTIRWLDPDCKVSEDNTSCDGLMGDDPQRVEIRILWALIK